MLQTLSANKTKIMAFTIAIAMILLYTMSFATTVYANSDNGKQSDQNIGISQDDSDQVEKKEKEAKLEKEDTAKPEKEDKDKESDKENKDDDSDDNDKDEDKNDKKDKDDESTTDTSGTQVRYHIQLSKGELKNLEQITLTITFEDENGDTVTDEVIMTTADHQGNHFTGNFAGTYRENSKTIVGYNAVISWTTTSDSIYEIDHQSNNGFGANSVINVFTKGKAANETEPEDLDDEENNDEENNNDEDDNNDQDSTGNTGNTGNNGSNGNTGTTTNNNTNANVNNTVTIGQTPAPQGAVLPPAAGTVAEDTTSEMVQTVILDEEATPLADAPVDDVPQTGVAEDTALLILMLLGSLAGIAILARKRDTIME